MPFAYPLTFTPRHGPWGYTNYARYKDWLRDEFAFRCVYCLTREAWCPFGHRDFAVEHITPQSLARHLTTVYDNLTYACHLCNSRKGTNLLPDPRLNPFGIHLRVNPDGTIDGLTRDGQKLILKLSLDEDERVELRRRYLDIYAEFQKPERQGDEFVKRQYEQAFSFPRSIPDLKAKRLRAGGNTRPRGVNCCYFQRFRGRQRTTPYFP